MARDYAAFLRDNRTPRMAPLRAALSASGLTDIDSFGSSGNFVFCAPDATPEMLEELIGETLGATALVRTREELASIVASDPFCGRPGAGVLLAREEADGAAGALRDASGADGSAPIVSGRTVYFVWPTRMPGRKAMVDFERVLGVTGTMRSSRVLARVLDLMGE